jgi:hypothetical protein
MDWVCDEEATNEYAVGELVDCVNEIHTWGLS